MVFAGLSLEQAPPYRTTVKFFVVGFIYAFLCGLYLFFEPNFYNPALIHLFTLGFMGAVMFGAVFQFLPVVGGVTFKRIGLLTNLVCIFLNLGVISFFFAFTTLQKELFFLAAAFLSAAVLILSISVIFKVIIQKVTNISILSIAIALFFLLTGMALGADMLSAYGVAKFSERFLIFKDIHLHFLLYGWSVILVMGISFQVIAMFWVTTPFSTKQKGFFVLAMSLILFMYAASLFFEAAAIVKTVLLLLTMAYAVFIIQRLQTRKRKLQDYSVNFWYIAMGSLFFSSILLLFQYQSLGYKIFAYGFIYSVITAMIYKILPFITWFFLSAKGLFDIPTMKEMVAQKSLQMVYILYITGFVILLLTQFFPQQSIKQFFAFIFLVLNLLHLYNFLMVIKIYTRLLAKP